MEVAEDALWLHTFGAEPQTEEVSGDECVRELVFTSEDGGRLHLTRDVVGDSLRIRWYQDGADLTVNVFREGVTRLLVEDEVPGVSGIRAHYRYDDLSATLRVQVWPSFRLHDAPHHVDRQG